MERRRRREARPAATPAGRHARKTARRRATRLRRGRSRQTGPHAGATSIEEPATFVTGDRFGVVMDPFGHRWAIMTRVENVPAEEAERRVQEWLASQAG